MSLKKVYKKIAKKYGVSTKEVEKEIAFAIKQSNSGHENSATSEEFIVKSAEETLEKIQ